MTAILLDTHAWIWSLDQPHRLGARARAAIEAAEITYLSPISFYEIGQKARLGKWPEMEALLPRLPQILAEEGGRAAPLTLEICLAAAAMDWEHRDPFDRIIAATAAALAAPLVSADPAFDRAGVARIW